MFEFCLVCLFFLLNGDVKLFAKKALLRMQLACFFMLLKCFFVLFFLFNYLLMYNAVT